jgi:hypothetical protein
MLFWMEKHLYQCVHQNANWQKRTEAYLCLLTPLLLISTTWLLHLLHTVFDLQKKTVTITNKQQQQHTDMKIGRNFKRSSSFKGQVWAVPWLRSLVADLSPRRPGFAPGSIHVGFVVDKVALGLVMWDGQFSGKFSDLNFSGKFSSLTLTRVDMSHAHDTS